MATTHQPSCSGRAVYIFLLILFVALSCGCATRDIHTAIIMGNEDRAVELIGKQKPKQIERRNAHSATPLHEAVVRNQLRVVQALLEVGAEVDPRMPHGHTPLFFVGRHADRRMLRMLVDAGADVNATLNNGLTVLCGMFIDIYDEGGYVRSAQVAEDLIAAGAKPELGTHTLTEPLPLLAWGTYFLARRARDQGDRAAVASRFETAATMFEHNAKQQRERHEALMKRSKGVAGRNFGRGVGSFFLGVATGVATGIVVTPTPQYESKRAILQQAELAERLAELYEKTRRECNEQLNAWRYRSAAGSDATDAADAPIVRDLQLQNRTATASHAFRWGMRMSLVPQPS